MNDLVKDVVVTPQRPLAVYILWHPDSPKAQQIAEGLFKKWQGDSTASGLQNPGIPVFFVSRPPEGHALPEAVDPGLASRVALVLLVDGVLVADVGWHQFIGRQVQLRASNPRLTILPVQLCDQAVTFHTALSRINFIRVPEMPDAKRITWIANRLNHALCRLLPSTVPGASQLRSQVRVFISHAKADGLGLARRIRDYINDKSQLDTFFDAHEIQYGEDWENTLEESLGNDEMALLAIQTDQYASRVYCRREILWAKKNAVPIVVLNAVKYSEVRGFPYLGNCPTLRWRSGSNEDVLGVLLSEVLRARHFPLQLRYLCAAVGRQTPEYLAYHPELLTLAFQPSPSVNSARRTIVYPDPPLGTEETDLLHLIRDDIQFTTPSVL